MVCNLVRYKEHIKDLQKNHDIFITGKKELDDNIFVKIHI